MAPHSSAPAWKIPWTEEPGGLRSMGSHRVRHDWSDLACLHALEEEMATHSSVLAWRIPGTGEPGGLLSMGSHRVGHDWSDLAAAAAAAVCFGTRLIYHSQDFANPSSCCRVPVAHSCCSIFVFPEYRIKLWPSKFFFFLLTAILCVCLVSQSCSTLC